MGEASLVRRASRAPQNRPDGRHVGFTTFQVERDSLWPAPALKAVGIGLLLSLLAVGGVVVRDRRTAGGAGAQPSGRDMR